MATTIRKSSTSSFSAPVKVKMDTRTTKKKTQSDFFVPGSPFGNYSGKESYSKK